MRPASAPSIVSAKIAITTQSITSIGIITLLTFSMPFSTPNITTAEVSATKMMNQSIGLSTMPPFIPMKFEKKSAELVARSLP